jgi:hypothetical protein
MQQPPCQLQGLTCSACTSLPPSISITTGQPLPLFLAPPLVLLLLLLLPAVSIVLLLLLLAASLLLLLLLLKE